MLNTLIPQLLAQQTETATHSGDPMLGLILVAVLIFFVASFWRLFTKAGAPGWASLIPFYNVIVLLRISGKPGWWFFLFLIPGVNLVVSIFMYLSLAESFGKGALFGLGLAFFPFIFVPILAFGSAEYTG